MASVIRKVSIGHDYRNCMNYVVGQYGLYLNNNREIFKTSEGGLGTD